MTLRLTCKTCGRSYADVLYHAVNGISLDEILKGSDYLKYGRECCILELYTASKNISLSDQKILIT